MLIIDWCWLWCHSGGSIAEQQYIGTNYEKLMELFHDFCAISYLAGSKQAQSFQFLLVSFRDALS